MKAEIKVLQPGLFTSIQDMGRMGYAKFGVPASGAMDLYAAKLANLIVNNSPNDAFLEITQSGPKLEFSHPAGFAITGGDLSPRLNDIAIENNYQYLVMAGDVLSFAGRRSGCRSYLAISGGFKTEKILGSRSWYDGISTHVRLTKGMRLEYEPVQMTATRTLATVRVQEDYLQSSWISCFPGPEYALLQEEEQKILNQNEFSISSKNNRMAIQIKELFPNTLKSIITGPVLPGTVQLTPGGSLVVLMRDCQTTGGYPRVLQLSNAGINALSQKIPGDIIKFHLHNYGN